MRAKVSYDADGEVYEIKVTDNSEVHAYAHMEGSSAELTTIYPLDGCEGVAGHHIHRALEYLESLPFVQAATIREKSAVGMDE